MQLMVLEGPPALSRFALEKVAARVREATGMTAGQRVVTVLPNSPEFVTLWFAQ